MIYKGFLQRFKNPLSYFVEAVTGEDFTLARNEGIKQVSCLMLARAIINNVVVNPVVYGGSSSGFSDKAQAHTSRNLGAIIAASRVWCSKTLPLQVETSDGSTIEQEVAASFLCGVPTHICCQVHNENVSLKAKRKTNDMSEVELEKRPKSRKSGDKTGGTILSQSNLSFKEPNVECIQFETGVSFSNVHRVIKRFKHRTNLKMLAHMRYETSPEGHNETSTKSL